MLAVVSNKVIMRFDMDELGFLNDDDVLEASRNFNDNNLESERFGRGSAGTNNVHDEDGDKYVDEKKKKKEDNGDYIPANEEGFEFVNK
ncbi:hypothetical protein D5086_032389 [Populus alba]|uniref:Uncharacterized protein n=1 Tax=Populus alba TaxID=43335 RepID=A0ACC4ALW4_POPAL